MRLLIVVALEKLCTLLDAVPRYNAGRWWRYGDWGCQLHLARRSAELDEQWRTGSWTHPAGEQR